MKTKLIVLFALAQMASNPSGRVFHALVDEFLAWHFQMSPVEATQIGVHDHDGRFGRYSLQSLDETAAQVQQFRVRLSQIDPGTLSAEDEIDFAILQEALDRMLFETTELQEITWNPMAVAQEVGFGIMLLVSQDFAPVEDRLPNLISRLQDVARALEEARETLQEATEVHTRTAVRQTRGALNLVSEGMYALLPTLDAEQEAHLRQAASRATAALESHATWLEETLLPEARRDFRLGERLYFRKLALTLREDITPEEILRRAHSELARTQQQMFALALPLYAQANAGSAASTHGDSLMTIRWALDQIAEDHVGRNEVLSNVTGTIEELEAFIREEDILTLDPRHPLEVRLMPEFQRGVSIASLEAPGPLEKGLKTFYNVSPIPEDWSEERAESFLREYNNISVKILSIHEALPGHYVQLYHANRHPSVLRAVFSSGVMVEGWAHYCETMLIQAGYGGGDPRYELVQKKWYLRGIANAIIDQGIHAHGMTEEEAIRLMVDETFQERSEAELKWVRAQLTSAQLSTYFVGTTLMWQLRSDMEAREGDRFNLRRFHEAVLAHGSPPIRHLRKVLL